MNIDATLFFDLLLLAMHINSDKTRILTDQLFELFHDNAQNIASGNVNLIKLYIDVIQEVINYKLNATDNRADIINLIIKHTSTPMFARNKEAKQALLTLVDSKVTPERLATIIERLNNVVIWYQVNTYVGKMYGNLKECRLTYNIEDQGDLIHDIKDLVTELKDTVMEIESSIGKNGPVEVIDFSNKDSLARAVDDYEEKAVKGVIRTGLQGLNQMLGKGGGFPIGNTSIFVALQHNFKSGILMYLMRWIAAYNPPEIRNPSKNLILFITLENVGYMNLVKMFEHLYTNIVGGDPTNLSKTEMVEYVYEYFTKLGYTLVIERYIPKAFGYDELVHLYEKYKAAGYEIKAVLVDYLEKMKKNGSGSKVGNHILIQELFNDCTNYFKAVGTNLFSAAQLNRNAADIAGSGIRHPVKNFSERHLAGSIDIGREVDFIAYTHIEKDEEGNSWLTMKWGKHRYIDDTPEAHKFAAWKFVDAQRGIPDDVNGEKTHVRDIYSVGGGDKSTDASTIEQLLGAG